MMGHPDRQRDYNGKQLELPLESGRADSYWWEDVLVVVAIVLWVLLIAGCAASSCDERTFGAWCLNGGGSVLAPVHQLNVDVVAFEDEQERSAEKERVHLLEDVEQGFDLVEVQVASPQVES